MKLLVLGIGRSSVYLLQYIQQYLIPSGTVECTAIDSNPELLLKRQQEFPSIQFVNASIEEILPSHDIIISLLPPSEHIKVIRLCLQYHKHFFSASYATPEIKALHQQALDKGILIAMEAGLDPGIDHMSALDILQKIQTSGGHITSFESYTGGLIHPDSSNPPWNYKISWNPKNVVLAGQGGDAIFLLEGKKQNVSYAQLFKETSHWKIDNQTYEGYYNRDSLSYIPLYKLNNIQTFIRGTLRYPGYCEAWSCLVDKGITQTNVTIPTSIKTEKDFWNYYMGTDYTSMSSFWNALGADSSESLPTQLKSPAEVLQYLMEKYWKLSPQDKDRIVMIHRLRYTQQQKQFEVISSLTVDGDNSSYTAMAKTVGLPLILWVELFIQKKYTSLGVQLPLTAEVYLPILEKLKDLGIQFKESSQQLP
ncbi:MAG: saccharopine dehydrogenase C-terminal domain-containing protein [Cytophagaceae bacterium]